jgi:hypothetical protein
MVEDQFFKSSQDTILTPKTIVFLANDTFFLFLLKKEMFDKM